jgi:UDP-glucose 4-epimerase
LKIGITGALGHIGSKLIRELPHRIDGLEIKMFDNMLVQRYCSLFDLPTTHKYSFIEADLFDLNLETEFDGCDLVIHLAAITDAASSFEKPELVEKINDQGTRIVADACAKVGAKMIYLSTTSVYGTQANVVDEDCSPEELKPQSPYAESKLSGERYLNKLGSSKGLDFITCRFGTIFGVSPGMRFQILLASRNGQTT